MVTRSACCLLIVAALWSQAGPVHAPPDQLRIALNLTSAQLQTLARGEVMVEHLPISSRDEIGVLGIVRIAVAPEVYLRAFADIELFEAGSAAAQTRRLSNPPARADLDGVALPDEDVRDMVRCRLEWCDVQLDAATLARLSQLRRGDAHARAAAVTIMRDMLFDLVQRYRATGNQALPVYRDTRVPRSVPGNLWAILQHTGPFPQDISPVRTFLAEYPHARLEGAQDLFFWTINSFGLKATGRMNHAVIYRPPDTKQVAGVIAIKQLYASHYFHGALELRFAVRDPSSASHFYLVCVNRSRSDGLTGFKGALIGSIVRRRALEGVRNYLRFTRDSTHRLTEGGAAR
jgi:hypothetical protein